MSATPVLTGFIEPVVTLASSPVGGIVSEVAASEGALVAEGQVLVRFDTSELETRRKELESSLNALKTAIENRNTFAQLPNEIQNIIRDAHPDVAKAEEAYARALSDFDAAESHERAAAKLRLDLAAQGRVTARARAHQSITTASVQESGEMIAALEARLAEIARLIRNAEVRSPAEGAVDLLKLHPGERVFPGMPVAAIVSKGTYFADVIVPYAPHAEGCKAILENGPVLDCRIESASVRKLPAVLRETRDKSDEIVARLVIFTDQEIPPATKARFELP
jgi:HlyD family secretion protein